ncbi:MAG: tetratricopeptide repeat protein [Nitrospiraceae bacterium]
MDEFSKVFAENISEDPIAEIARMWLDSLRSKSSKVPPSSLQNLGRFLGLDGKTMRVSFDEDGLESISDDDLIKLLDKAYALCDDGLYFEAIPVMTLYIQSVEYKLDHIEGQDNVVLRVASLASGKALLGSIHEKVGQLLKAQEHFEQAIKLYDIISKNNYIDEIGIERSKVLDKLARVNEVLGDFQQAEELFTQSLVTRQEIYGLDHPEFAISLRNLAGLYESTGDLQRAKELYDLALQIFKSALGADDIEVAITLADASHIYKTDVKQAIIYLERALTIFKKQLEPSHPRLVSTSSSLAARYLAVSKTNQAKKTLEHVVQIQEQTPGPKCDDYANVLNCLGVMAESRGDFDEAEEYFSKAMEMWRNRFGSKHVHVGSVLRNLGELYISKKSFSRGLQALRQSLEVFYTNAQHKLNVAAVGEMKTVSLLNFIFRVHRFLSLTVKHASNGEEIRNGYKWTLRCKGLVLDEQSRINNLIRSELPEDAQKDCATRLDLFGQLVNFTVV